MSVPQRHYLVANATIVSPCNDVASQLVGGVAVCLSVDFAAIRRYFDPRNLMWFNFRTLGNNNPRVVFLGHAM